MKVIDKLLYRRFTKDEYKELKEMLAEEEKMLMKRPGYITGNILMLGLFLYFVARAFGPENYKWPDTGDVVGVVVGVCFGGFVFWLLLKRWKARSASMTFMVGFWCVWMVLFGLLTTGQEGSRTHWDFVSYASLTFFGWMLSCNSVKEHLCEKMLRVRKGEETGGKAEL